MPKLLIVSPDKNSLYGLASALAEHADVDLSWAESGKTALKIATDSAIDLVVTDESLGDMTGLEFASKLLSVNPMINCASASSLSHEEFHEISEGLGIMVQLPLRPGKEHAEELLQRLKKLKMLMADVKDYST
jgi:CheY-like chemotaxis protein